MRKVLAAIGSHCILYTWQMSFRHHDGSSLSFFDAYSKRAKRACLEANPQIFHPDSTRLP